MLERIEYLIIQYKELICLFFIMMIAAWALGPYKEFFMLFFIAAAHAYLSLRLYDFLRLKVLYPRDIGLALCFLAIAFIFLAPLYFCLFFIDDAIAALIVFFKKAELFFVHDPQGLDSISIEEFLSLERIAIGIKALIKTSELFTIVFKIVCFFVFSIFFTFHHTEVLGFLDKQWPESFEISRLFFYKSVRILDDYLIGKIIHCFVLIVLSEMIFQFFDLPFAHEIAFFMGLAVFVPFVGTAIATLPLVVVIYQRWGWELWGVLALGSHFALHLVNEAFITPLIFSKTNHLHPALIIGGILFFGKIGGAWGIFLSIPLLSILIESIKTSCVLLKKRAIE